MNIVCNRNDLLKAVGTVSKAVSVRTTMPILEDILLDGSGDTLTLLGNDLEMGIQTSIEAVVRTEGSVAVNARMFGEIIRRLPDEDVKIETTNEGQMSIECARSKFTMGTLSGKDFPRLPEIKKEQEIMINQAVLRDMISNTIFSIAPENSGRPVLTGELFDVRDGNLYIVAVDGFRISMKKTPVISSNNFKVTIPGKALSEICKILDSEEESVATMVFTGKHAMFNINRTVVLTRLLEGNFLDYERNLSMDFKTKISVSRKDLLDSVDRAALISRESKNSPIRLEIDENKMVITSNAETGTAREEVEVDMKEGEPLNIAFNPKYYMDALKAISDDTIIINFSSALTPCIIEGEEGGDYKYFILPIRLHG
ncbi:MAG: DNA polymerase III subunit beta [Lachnospiraceae bacterium]|nr:DNA polymerase III subunit beta [Lachnospiraceae bacterium]